MPGDGLRGAGGDGSFVEFRESHENGPVSFLGRPGCALSFGGGGGTDEADVEEPPNQLVFRDARAGSSGFTGSKIDLLALPYLSRLGMFMRTRFSLRSSVGICGVIVEFHICQTRDGYTVLFRLW